MQIVDRLLQESFASYVGWYLTEKYYAELGYTKSPGEDISGQDRQSWTSSVSGSMGYYSPLFVDLVDAFDQSSLYMAYNRDEIKSVHYATIMRIARESSNWTSCKSILREDPGQDWDTFMAPYDLWYQNRTY
jgi:hypothetical protein